MTGPFKMTDALRRTFSIAFGEARLLLPLVFLVLLPEFLLVGAWVGTVWSRPEAMEEQQWLVSLVETPVSFILKQLAVAAVIPLVFSRLRGERPSAPGRAVRRAVSRLLPLLGLAIVVGLAVMGGTFACVVPGLMVYCALFVATPTLMVEEVGVGDAWRRSFELTRGYRWEIFGVVFVIWAIGAGIGSLSLVTIPSVMRDPEGFMRYHLALSSGLGLVVALLNTLLIAVAATVVYHDLRRTKEGLGDEDLLAVFA